MGKCSYDLVQIYALLRCKFWKISKWEIACWTSTNHKL